MGICPKKMHLILCVGNQNCTDWHKTLGKWIWQKRWLESNFARAHECKESNWYFCSSVFYTIGFAVLLIGGRIWAMLMVKWVGWRKWVCGWILRGSVGGFDADASSFNRGQATQLHYNCNAIQCNCIGVVCNTITGDTTITQDNTINKQTNKQTNQVSIAAKRHADTTALQLHRM